MGFLILNDNIKEILTPEIKKIDGLKGKNKKKYIVNKFLIKLFLRMKLKQVLQKMCAGFVTNGMN
jgi:hypothetical protein